MTTPVTTDDLVQGAVKWLTDLPDVVAVLGAQYGGIAWLFQHHLQVVVEGTSSTAAVIARAGGWAGANLHNTMRFPRLSLDLYVDPQRDAAHHVTDHGEAQRRIEAAYLVFDTHLHRPQSQALMWGTVRTISCTRLAEPTVYPMPETDGVLRLQVHYAVAQG